MKKPTAAQQQRIDALIADGAERIWAEPVDAKAVIQQMTRYLKNADSSQIGTALYRFLMNVSSFIAHYDLHGFRDQFTEPAVLIDEFLAYDRSHVGSWNARGEARRVYRDGITDLELYTTIRHLASGAQTKAHADMQARTRERELAAAHDIARRYGVAIDPASTPAPQPASPPAPAPKQTARAVAAATAGSAQDTRVATLF